VHLSYFDDSGSDNSSSICVFGGVVIEGNRFGFTEAWSHTAVEYLGISDSFDEFKASDLYFGVGPFAPAGKEKCREAFLLLLRHSYAQCHFLDQPMRSMWPFKCASDNLKLGLATNKGNKRVR
jgi:hypothetical protein